MENPITQNRPDDPILRIHDYARDLAYGAREGYWDAQISVDDEGKWTAIKNLHQHVGEHTDKDNFLTKWHPRNTSYIVPTPSFSLLVSFGYLEKIGERGEKVIHYSRRARDFTSDKSISAPFEIDYILTSSAFALLYKPASPPSIFISHKQDQSSAFALLIEARLKLQDSNVGVFIDRDIPPGEKWNGFLEDRVKHSQYFICLLTLETLTSIGVRDEIQWALENPDRKIIPICHNDYDFGKIYPDDKPKPRVIPKEMIQTLSEWQAIIVEQEKAEYYDFAILKLLNRLGYSVVK